MQAYGEGYELLAAVDLIEDVPGVIKSWTQGTVIRSWLLDLLVRALQQDPELADITGYAEASGEGRWTVEAAIDNAVPMHVIAASLFARFTSRQDDSPAMKAVAAMRKGFGGHATTGAAPAGTPPTTDDVDSPADK
jgi:6-phosphogluconate dehydrogenase